MATADGGGWYWCVQHGRVEGEDDACAADDRMGPYPSEDAARNWRQLAEAREEKWKADDRAWSGEDDE